MKQKTVPLKNIILVKPNNIDDNKNREKTSSKSMSSIVAVRKLGGGELE
jgi:hypothetical protein